MCWFRILVVVWILPGFAQGQHAISVGSASAILDSTLFDPLNYAENPASVAGVSSFQYGVFAGRYKDVRGLNFFAGCFAFPLSHAGVALLVYHSGTAGMQENKADLLIARELGGLCLGVQFNTSIINVVSVGGYKNLDVGIGITRSSGQLSMGISMHRMGLLNRQPPAQQITGVRVGIQSLFRISSLVSVGVSSSKVPGQPVVLQPAVYYQAGLLQFSSGFDVNAGTIFLITGWCRQRFRIRILLSYQSTLGIFHGTQFLLKQGTE